MRTALGLGRARRRGSALRYRARWWVEPVRAALYPFQLRLLEGLLRHGLAAAVLSSTRALGPPI